MKISVFIRLFPVFILFFLVFWVSSNKSLDFGDEARYAQYAENLTNGFYAPHDTLFLWNGPGYPLLLTPFAFFKVPWFYAKMLNPVFLFLACCFIYSALRNFMSAGRALLFSYIFGLYPPFYAEIGMLLTEAFSLMLVTAFILIVIKWFNTGKYRFLFLSGFFIAYLALTKVYFGYVILACLFLTLIFLKCSRTCLKSLPVFALGLLFCTPYLFYTYKLTGKIFYWANSGGSTVYWMTTPYPEEFGDWKWDETVMNQPELARHKPFFEKLTGLNYVQQDDMMKKQALDNIVKYPRKVLFNWIANISRLWLNFPFSYKYQHPRTLFYMIPGALLLSATLFSIYPIVKLRRNLPVPIIYLIGFCLVYLMGQSCLYAEARYLCPLMPFIFIIITYTATNLIKIEGYQEKVQIE